MEELEELPPFLRDTQRFQDCFEGFDVERFLYDYGQEGEISLWRETELSTSRLATLLETEGVVKALFEFLGDAGYSTHIVWISRDSFLSNEERLHMPEETAGRLNLLFHVDLGNIWLSRRPYFYRIVSTTPNRTTSIVSEELGTILLRALAKDTTDQVELGSDQLPSTEPFPASLEALKAFVGEAQSPRLVNFSSPSLSVEQWKVITSSCNQNVGLFFSRGAWQNGGCPLINAMKLNQCPTRLIIYCDCFGGLSKVTITAFVAALEANTSLTNLSLDLEHVSTENLALLFGAISRNCGLQTLELASINNLLDSEYELLWRVALASHPTLRSVTLCALPVSEARDRILVRAMRSNTTLLELDYERVVQNKGAVKAQVQPILELNRRFGPLVQSIKHERHETRRERLFARTLLSDCVCDRPAFRYLLLKENPDLLVQFFSRREYELRQQWYNEMDKMFSFMLATTRRLVSVEQRMRDDGMVPPSNESYFSCGHKRKRS